MRLRLRDKISRSSNGLCGATVNSRYAHKVQVGSKRDTIGRSSDTREGNNVRGHLYIKRDLNDQLIYYN
jgi:hypothetical protein